MSGGQSKSSTASWQWLGGVVLIVLAMALPFALSSYHVFELTQVMIYAIAVLGLNILTGYNGQISLGHGGFFAAGAYTAAILMHRYGVPYWATLAPAALICFALGVLFGLPALRFEGPYLALVTLDGGCHAAIAEIFRHLDRRQSGHCPHQACTAGRDWARSRSLAVFSGSHRAAPGDARGRQSAQWPHRARVCRDPRPSHRSCRHGHQYRAL